MYSTHIFNHPFLRKSQAIKATPSRQLSPRTRAQGFAQTNLPICIKDFRGKNWFLPDQVLRGERKSIPGKKSIQPQTTTANSILMTFALTISQTRRRGQTK